MAKQAKKDLLHSIKSKFGIVTHRSYDPTIVDRVDEYLAKGFTVYVRCTECNNIHQVNTNCQVCDKVYDGYQ